MYHLLGENADSKFNPVIGDVFADFEEERDFCSTIISCAELCKNIVKLNDTGKDAIPFQPLW